MGIFRVDLENDGLAVDVELDFKAIDGPNLPAIECDGDAKEWTELIDYFSIAVATEIPIIFMLLFFWITFAMVPGEVSNDINIIFSKS